MICPYSSSSTLKENKYIYIFIYRMMQDVHRMTYYVYIYICIYICIYIYVYIYILYMYIYIHIYIYIYYKSMCTYVYIYIYHTWRFPKSLGIQTSPSPRARRQRSILCTPDSRISHIDEGWWAHKKLYETIWNYMKLYETIWNYMKLYETIWNYGL